MKVFVLGATGVIGWRAVRELVAAGHEVTGVTRTRAKAARLAALGAEPVRADPFDLRSLGMAFAGHDAVVNLMTHIPPAEDMARPGAWEENDRLRRVAAPLVADAARTVGVRRLVQESVTLLYADHGAEWIVEDARLDPAGPPAAAAAAEAGARTFGDAVILRFGTFYGPDSELTLGMLDKARDGWSPSVASADAYTSSIWLDDAGRAVAAAVTAPAGTYNVVDDEPLTRAEADAALAAAVRRERLRAPLGRALPAARALARSQRVSNAAFRAATGWAPHVRDQWKGWRRLVAELEPEGAAA